MDIVRRIAFKLDSPKDLLRRIGPYVVLEMLMPGGTLLALGLFLYRRRRAHSGGVLREWIALK